MSQSQWIAGIDVGGTFTDLIAVDAASGEVRLAKVPTTPENQAFGVLNALQDAGLPLAEVAMIVHGTTTTTNAVLERKLSKTGVITAQGFRDVLELGRWIHVAVTISPSNAGAGHVTLAVGRDYGDVTPLRGVIRGSATHTLTVAVHTRVEDPPEAVSADPERELLRTPAMMKDTP